MLSRHEQRSELRATEVREVTRERFRGRRTVKAKSISFPSPFVPRYRACGFVYANPPIFPRHLSS